jgi:hypothetical protein
METSIENEKRYYNFLLSFFWCSVEAPQRRGRGRCGMTEGDARVLGFMFAAITFASFLCFILGQIVDALH